MFVKTLFFITIIFLSGCNTKAINTSQFSGFLTSYKDLTFDKNQNAYRWIDESTIRHYHSVVITPIQVYPANQANPAIAQQATSYLEEQFTNRLRGRKKLKSRPGNGVLQLRAAITSITKKTEGFKAYEILPIAAVYKGIQAAAGERATYIDVNLEAELVDSQTGKVVAALVEKTIGETQKRSEDQLEFSDAKPTLDKWVIRFDKFIEGNIKGDL